MLDSFLAWLRELPPATLYAVAALSAAIENLFPPLPSDVIVAFAAFAAARGRGAVLPAFLAVLAGNVAGAMVMYAIGARYGADAVLRRLGGEAQEARLRAWYGRFGIAAIVVSRFLPGVRAIVPPMAGALGIGPVRSMLALAFPSGLWYGGITYLAYTAGGDFDVLRRRMATGQRWVGIAAVALVLVLGAAWWIRRRRRTIQADAAGTDHAPDDGQP